MNCPTCKTATRAHDDESYYGEMRVCDTCGFQAYFDQWDENGNYTPSADIFSEATGEVRS